MNRIKSSVNIFHFFPFLAGKKTGGEKKKNLQQGKKWILCRIYTPAIISKQIESLWNIMKNNLSRIIHDSYNPDVYALFVSLRKKLEKECIKIQTLLTGNKDMIELSIFFFGKFRIILV